MKLLLAMTLLLSVSARAQFGAQSAPGGGGPKEDEGIGVNAGQNAFYSIQNRFNGFSLIQIAKLSLINGGQYWSQIYNPGYDAFATAAAKDRDSNIFIVGTVRQQGFTRQILVLKYAPNGGFYWDYVYPTQSNAVPTSAATDQDGNLFLAATINVQGGSELHVIKVSSNRGVLADMVYRQGRTNYGDSMTVDPSGNVEVTVRSTYGDAASGAYQTQRVLFSGNGGGWRPL